MQHAKPFVVYQPAPGQTAKPLFVIHAYRHGRRPSYPQAQTGFLLLANLPLRDFKIGRHHFLH